MKIKKIPRKKEGSATIAGLQNWYEELGGKAIVEECKESDTPDETWNRLTIQYNNEHLAKQGLYIPTSINGIVYVFGVKTSSFYNCAKLLSGERLTEEEMNSSKNKYRATKEQLILWYTKMGGKETVWNCRKTGNFAGSWRTYADEFNKKEFYEHGFRLQNNKVGLVTALGGTDYSIPEIVRLFEGLPEGTEIPDIEREVKAKVRTIVVREKKEKPQKIAPPKIRVTKESVPKIAKPRVEKVPKIPKKPVHPQVTAIPESIVGKVQESMEKAMRTGENPPLSVQTVEKPISAAKETKKEELSEWIIDFSRRFPNFLGIHRKFYTPFRKFIQVLEKTYPDEGEIDSKHMRIDISARGLMIVTIAKCYIDEQHNSSHILDIFHEVESWYTELCDQNKKFLLVEMSLRIEL